MADIKTVGALVAELLKQNQDAPLRVSVRWAGDTAIADLGEITVTENADEVSVVGWMSGCDTELDIADEEETDED